MRYIAGVLFAPDHNAGMSTESTLRALAACTPLESHCAGPAVFACGASSQPNSRSANLRIHDDVWLVFDGRLDDRDALLAELDLAGSDEHPDITLVYAAYRRWGEQLVKHLLGDFVFAIYEPQTHRLLCARDHLGIRPLYYVHGDGFFAFANDIQLLCALPQWQPELSKTAVAIYLTLGDLYHPERTFYANLLKLPPASTLTLDGAATTVDRYWDIERCPNLTAAPVSDFVERLEGLLRVAVRDRTLDGTTQGAHLSGGLDSSALVALCAGQATPEAQSLHTFSWMPPPESAAQRKDPEWSHSAAIARSLNLPHEYTPFDTNRMCQLITRLDVGRGDSVDLWYEHFLRERAGALGLEAILSGWGGDQFASHSGYLAPTHRALHGEALTLFRELRNATRGLPWPTLRACKRFFSQTVLIPLVLWYKQQFAVYRADRFDLLECCRPAFRDWARDRRPYHARLEPLRFRSAQLLDYRQGHLQRRLESWAASALPAGLEYRFPLLDKRIVEFALGLPPALFRREGRNRYVFREAVARFASEEIVETRLKEERERVKILRRVEVQALKAWRGHEGREWQEHEIIDVPALFALIDSLPEAWQPDFDLLVRVRTALQSVLVLNLGKSLPEGRQVHWCD